MKSLLILALVMAAPAVTLARGNPKSETEAKLYSEGFANCNECRVAYAAQIGLAPKVYDPMGFAAEQTASATQTPGTEQRSTR